MWCTCFLYGLILLVARILGYLIMLTGSGNILILGSFGRSSSFSIDCSGRPQNNMIAERKRPLESAVATQPAKYFKHFDMCRHSDADNLQKEDVDNVREVSEHSKVKKHGDYTVKGDFALEMLNCQDEIASKTQQAVLSVACRDEVPLKELRALERLRSTLDRQDQCSPRSCCESSPLHPSHIELTAVSSQFIPQTVVVPELYNEKAQAPNDSQDQLPYRNVPIGSDFQVFVPAWKPPCITQATPTDLHYEAWKEQIDIDDAYDDSKWLGSQVWPLVESKNTGSEDQVGRGRPDSCYCEYPDSADCVRLHIQEENAKLELTLGKAFQLWGFNDMGDSLAQNWTEEEQEQFKTLVKLNPPSCEKNFWHHLPSTFPNRSTRDFVSFYFNVFVLQRRAMQNRLGPDHVDSDDDQCSLTSSDYEESEDYVTDVDYDSDGSEEESWQNIIDSEPGTSWEVSDFSEPAIQSDQCISVKHNADCLRDDASNTGSIEELMSSSTSKEDALVDLQSVGHLICSAQSISSWHHSLQASVNYLEETSNAVGESGCQGGKDGRRITGKAKMLSLA